MVAQIAISFVILVAAGLFVRTLNNLHSVQLGYAREHILLFSLNARQAGHGNPEMATFYANLRKRFESIPGVNSATLSNSSIINAGRAGAIRGPMKIGAVITLVTHGFNDKDVDDLIEHFRDKERRKEFFKEFKELEMLFEIIAPDAFLRPFMDDYAFLSAIYAVVAKAYTKTVYVYKAFERKTNELVQKHVMSSPIAAVTDFIAINEETIDLIKEKHGGDDTKVINLIKSIEKTAEEESGDPFLIAMADRAKAIQENYEDRQTSTQEALDDLLAEIQRNEQRKREQAQKEYDSLRYFVFTTIQEAGVGNGGTCPGSHDPQDAEEMGKLFDRRKTHV